MFRLLFLNDVEARSPEPNYDLWRFLFFDNIYKVFYNVPDICEIVLAMDSRNPWRKLYWSRYKESRKLKRDKQDDVDWQRFFNMSNSFLADIKRHIPFKVLKVKSAEADDIIAGIVLNGDKEKYHIVSNDEDFLQLCSENVKLYNPTKKKYVECDNPEDFLVKKCLIGQPKDDIFNIKTPLDHPVGKRKPGFGVKSAEKVINEGYEKWLEKNDLTKRFKVNRILMDFNMIPDTMIERIKGEYFNYEYPEVARIWQFIGRYSWREYQENFDEVEQNLRRLY